MRKKLLAAALAAALLCTASCGKNEKPAETAAEKKTPAVTKEAEDTSVPAADITSAVLDAAPISSAIEKTGEELSYYFDALEIGDLTDSSFYMCASGAYPDEIAVFKFGSADKAEKGLDAVKKRLEHQKSTYETYTPAEAYKFDDAVAKTNGCYVVYLVTSDNAAAEEIADSYIDGTYLMLNMQ